MGIYRVVGPCRFVMYLRTTTRRFLAALAKYPVAIVRDIAIRFSFETANAAAIHSASSSE